MRELVQGAFDNIQTAAEHVAKTMTLQDMVLRAHGQESARRGS